MNFSAPDPPQRGHLLTEQRLEASADLDQLSIERTLCLINDQDATIAAAVRRTIPAMSRLVEAVVNSLRRGGRLIYLGAGTSGRLGVLDASECPPTFFCEPQQVVGVIAGGDTALRLGVEGAEDDPRGAAQALEDLRAGSNDVVVGIAAGGTTPYVVGALELAKQRGCVTGLVTCVQAHAPAADHVIELLVGPEVLTGSTRMKAGTATKLALNMISTTAMVQLGKAWGNLMVDLRVSNAKLADRAARILQQQCQVTRAEALAALEQAQGRVKLALVMLHRRVDAQQAQRLLDKHEQKLSALLGPPR